MQLLSTSWGTEEGPGFPMQPKVRATSSKNNNTLPIFHLLKLWLCPYLLFDIAVYAGMSASIEIKLIYFFFFL
jgi:hypothetical protein